MSAGFRVNPDALERAGKRLNGLRAKADGIEKKVTEAEVPAIAWGALGLATNLYGGYAAMIKDLRNCVRQAAEGVAHAGDKLGQCGAGYRAADDRTQTSLVELAKKLDQPTGPGKA